MGAVKKSDFDDEFLDLATLEDLLYLEETMLQAMSMNTAKKPRAKQFLVSIRKRIKNYKVKVKK